MSSRTYDSLARLRSVVRARTTQRALANSLETTEATVSRWLSGQHEPSLENLAKICRHLEVSADYLLGLVDDPAGRRDGGRTRPVPIFSLVEVGCGDGLKWGPDRRILGLPTDMAPSGAIAVTVRSDLLDVVDTSFELPYTTVGPEPHPPAWGMIVGHPFLVSLPDGPGVFQFLAPHTSDDETKTALKFAHISDEWKDETVDVPTDELSSVFLGAVVVWVKRVPKPPREQTVTNGM